MLEIKDEGFDELIETFEGMRITEQAERAALNAGGEVIKKSMEENAPRGRTGRLSGKIKKSIKRLGGDLTIIVSTTSFYDIFTEFGTSQSKHKVGWANRAINDSEKRAIAEIVKKVLK